MEPQSEHLDPTGEISLETIKERTIKGVVALTGRYFVLYIITLVAQGFLGALLTTAQFGIFGIVSAIINFLVYFSDIGLAASLIQKKDKISEDDLKTTFTIQQILVLSILVILFVSTPFIKQIYNLDQTAIFLLYALGLSFLMSSLKTIPSVLLERGLRFEILAISNILENITYNFVLVFMAWKGFGLSSFTYAVLVRGVVGLVTIYFFKPWKPAFAINKISLTHLLKFGVPYQLNTFIAVLKDDGLTIVLGKIIGFDALGILVWAQKWIQIPLRVVLDNVTRVTFPAFSRMQDDNKSLERSVTRSIFFITFLVFPAVCGILILAPVVFEIIPKYKQWVPALFPMTLLAVNVLFASVSTQLTNLLNAIGKIKITSVFMVMWAVLTWLLVPYMAHKFGVNGAAFGYALVGASSLIVISITRKYVKFSIYDSVLRPLLASIAMSVVLLVLKRTLPANAASVGVLITVGVVAYAISMLILVGQSLFEDAKKGFKSIITK